MANQTSNPGNFANDPERAAEAGRKGGEQSHQGAHTSELEKQQSQSGDKTGQQSGSTHKSGEPSHQSGHTSDHEKQQGQSGSKTGQQQSGAGHKSGEHGSKS